MRLTPLDVRKQEFRKAMRGLDGDEVYAFLATVADEYEAVLNDNKALRERLLELDDKVQEYRNMEKTLRDTLLTAERVTVESKDSARREADLIIKEAQLEAEKGVRDVKESAMRLRQEIQNLKQQRDSYLARMKAVVESHLKYLDVAEGDFAVEEQKLDDDIKKWTGQTEVTRTPPVMEKPAAPRPEPAARPEPRVESAPRPAPPVDPPTRTPAPGSATVDEPKQEGFAPRTTPEPPSTVYRETVEADRPSSMTTDAPSAIAVAEKPEVEVAVPAVPKNIAVATAEPEANAKPSLKELLDRVIDTHANENKSEAPTPDHAPAAAGDEASGGDEAAGGSKWSLSRLKNDILARSRSDEEDRNDD